MNWRGKVLNTPPKLVCSPCPQLKGGLMPSFGLIYPVLPGKESVVREVGSQLRERRSEREESRLRGGVTVERAYLQKNPDGSSLVVAYLEADRSFGEVMGALSSSDLPLDR